MRSVIASPTDPGSDCKGNECQASNTESFVSEIELTCLLYIELKKYYELERCLISLQQEIKNGLLELKFSDSKYLFNNNTPSSWPQIKIQDELSEQLLEQVSSKFYFLKYITARKHFEYNEFMLSNKALLNLTKYPIPTLKQFYKNNPTVFFDSMRLGGMSSAYLDNQHTLNIFLNEVYNKRDNYWPLILNDDQMFQITKEAILDIHLANNNFEYARLINLIKPENDISIFKIVLGVSTLYYAGGSGKLWALDAAQGLDTLSEAYKIGKVVDPIPLDYKNARIAAEFGELDKAIKLFENILVKTKFGKKSHKSITILAIQEYVKLIKSDFKKEKLLKIALDLVESTRKNINTDAAKIAFQSNYQEVYSELIKLYVTKQSLEEAFMLAEKAKARALSDLLAQETIKTINMTKDRYDSMHNTGKKQTATNEDLYRGYLDFLNDGLTNNVIKSTGLSEQIKLDQIQSLLTDKQAIIEFYGNTETLFLFYIQKNKIKVHSIEQGSIELLIEDYRNAIKNKDQVIVSTLAELLFERLLSPVKAELYNLDSVYIIPHGKLNHLPFYSLKNNEDNAYVVDITEVRILPNASSLNYLKKQYEIETNNIILGNPQTNLELLPGAEQEAISIAKINNKQSLLLKDKATETVFKNLDKNVDIIHFAGHAAMNPDNPMKSALFLSKDNYNDGSLYLEEIYGQSINANLLILSACETSLGSSKGDEFMGFSRSFFSAGVKSIISSFWKVDDNSTALMMKKFYTFKSKLKSPSALRKAILLMKNSNPKSVDKWASFQYVGA